MCHATKESETGASSRQSLNPWTLVWGHGVSTVFDDGHVDVSASHSKPVSGMMACDRVERYDVAGLMGLMGQSHAKGISESTAQVQ